MRNYRSDASYPTICLLHLTIDQALSQPCHDPQRQNLSKANFGPYGRTAVTVISADSDVCIFT